VFWCRPCRKDVAPRPILCDFGNNPGRLWNDSASGQKMTMNREKTCGRGDSGLKRGTPPARGHYSRLPAFGAKQMGATKSNSGDKTRTGPKPTRPGIKSPG